MNREMLADIYDHDAQPYRRGEGQAFTVIGKSAAVLIQWNWSVTWRDKIPEIPDRMDAAIRGWLGSPSENSSASLSELLMWASQRGALDSWSPTSGEDDAPMFGVQRSTVDAQRCGSTIVNRRLVREVLQVFVQGRRGDLGIGMRIADVETGSMLILESNGTQCFVMGMKQDQEVGDDPMPGWSR